MPEISPLPNQVGCEVLGVDLSAPVGDSLRQDLKELWLEHGLLLFRGQDNSPEVLIRFSRLFGELERHPLVRSKEYPELFVVDFDDRKVNPVSYYDGEPVVGRLSWHKDLVYTARPNRGAVLTPVIRPAQGGETGFIDQARAYDELPAATRARIDGLEVVYRFDVQLRKMRFFDDPGYQPGPGVPKSVADVGFPDFPDCVYPLVLRHPESGRRILNVCSYFMHKVHDMDCAEGDRLLRELLDHLLDPSRIYYHDWEQHDMLLWDNWRFTHSARGASPDQRRFFHRTTIAGDVALGRPLN